MAAPPPYTSTPSSQSLATQGSIKKKAPPPPPPLKPKPSYGATYATAIFDFEAQVRLVPLFLSRSPSLLLLSEIETGTDTLSQAEGDLSFTAGDRIEIVERTESADDWWTGRIDGRTGIFPGTYTQVDGA